MSSFFKAANLSSSRAPRTHGAVTVKYLSLSTGIRIELRNIYVLNAGRCLSHSENGWLSHKPIMNIAREKTRYLQLTFIWHNCDLMGLNPIKIFARSFFQLGLYSPIYVSDK